MKLDTSSQVRQPYQPASLPKFSKLAVFALILAVVPCCPMLSLLGGALGLVAFQRIKLSGGRLTGKRTAIAAGITGFALSLVSSLALNGLANYIERTNNAIMHERILTAVNTSWAPDHATVRRQFAPAAQPALLDDAVDAFGKAAQERYGRLQRFSITSTAERGVFDRQIDVAGLFVFDRAQQLGSASFEIRATMNQYWPEIRLIELRIEDKKEGDLRLPPKSAMP
jgi:hypothetical protein